MGKTEKPNDDGEPRLENNPISETKNVISIPVERLIYGKPWTSWGSGDHGTIAATKGKENAGFGYTNSVFKPVENWPETRFGTKEIPPIQKSEPGKEVPYFVSFRLANHIAMVDVGFSMNESFGGATPSPTNRIHIQHQIHEIERSVYLGLIKKGSLILSIAKPHPMLVELSDRGAAELTPSVTVPTQDEHGLSTYLSKLDKKRAIGIASSTSEILTRVNGGDRVFVEDINPGTGEELTSREKILMMDAITALLSYSETIPKNFSWSTEPVISPYNNWDTVIMGEKKAKQPYISRGMSVVLANSISVNETNLLSLQEQLSILH